MKHSQATKVHAPYSWTYANEAARTGATGFISEDVGKLAWQQDNDTLWFLTETTPTWQALVGAHTHIEAQITDMSHYDSTAIHDNIAGEINAITQKTSPVNSDLILIEDSEASFTKKKITVGNFPTGWTVAATPPASSSGNGWFNTTNGVLYVYDGTRSKWLSISRHSLLYGKSGNADGAYLEAVGGVIDANGGYPVPFNSTIVGLAVHAVSGEINKGFEIHVDGVSAGSYALSTYDYANTALDIDVSSGSYISIFISSAGAGTGNIVANMIVAWRHT